MEPGFSVRLSYFADRKYVDISTISAAFFRAVGMNSSDPLIETEAIRLFREIVCHGELRSGNDGEGASASFRYSMGGAAHQLFYFESSERISERTPEPQFQWWDHVQVSRGEAGFIRPLGNCMTYNLMVMGKVLILHEKSRVPRVVSTDLRFPLRPNDYARLKMELRDLRNDFVQLRTYVEGREHGIVNVKLLAETEALSRPPSEVRGPH